VFRKCIDGSLAPLDYSTIVTLLPMARKVPGAISPVVAAQRANKQ